MPRPRANTGVNKNLGPTSRKPTNLMTMLPTSKPKWHSVTQHMCLCKRPGAALTIVLTVLKRGGYSAIAIEVADVSTLAAGLENHSHQLLGEKFKSLAAARTAAEKYAKKWLKAKVPAAPKCACGDIDPPKSTPPKKTSTPPKTSIFGPRPVPSRAVSHRA